MLICFCFVKNVSKNTRGWQKSSRKRQTAKFSNKSIMSIRKKSAAQVILSFPASICESNRFSLSFVVKLFSVRYQRGSVNCQKKIFDFKYSSKLWPIDVNLFNKKNWSKSAFEKTSNTFSHVSSFTLEIIFFFFLFLLKQGKRVSIFLRICKKVNIYEKNTLFLKTCGVKECVQQARENLKRSTLSPSLTHSRDSCKIWAEYERKCVIDLRVVSSRVYIHF